MQPTAEAPARNALYEEYGTAAPEVVLSHLFLKHLSEPPDLATFSIRSGVQLADRMRNKPVPGYEIYLGDRIDFLTESKLLSCLEKGTVEVWIQGSLLRLRSKLYDRTRELSFSFFQLQEEVSTFLRKVLDEACPGETFETLGEIQVEMRKLFPPKLKKDGTPEEEWTFEKATAGQLRLFNRELVKALVKRLKRSRSEETSEVCPPKRSKR